MTIKYHWENVECNIEDKDNEFEMKTHKEIRDIDYDYEISVHINDLVDYLMPYYLRKRDKNKEEINETKLANHYMTKAIEFMLEHGVDQVDFEIALEDDQYFVEFIHDRYEEQAFEDWNENYNEEYL